MLIGAVLLNVGSCSTALYTHSVSTQSLRFQPQTSTQLYLIGLSMFSTTKPEKIELGLSSLLTEKRDWIRGRSIGLITNHTGVDAALRSNYRLLAEAPACQLSAIFTPEHGLWGAVQDGITVNNTDAAEGNPLSVPVFSLYGQSMRPTADQLQGIDLLIYDMQDVGSALLHLYFDPVVRDGSSRRLRNRVYCR